jgi:lipid-A-disaccharide synthase
VSDDISPASVRQPSLTVFLVAAEESGDRLGAALMRALRSRVAGTVRFAGVGGREMATEGLSSLFPIHGIGNIGVASVAGRLPALLRNIRIAADAAVAARPDVLVIIDSPDFTHRIARRVRKHAPAIPIIDYVAPSVWAWRPWRARAMRRYIDHVLALLPFEPAAFARLGGPPCSYVGHPLIDEIDDLRPNPDEARRRLTEPPVVLVLPGSRASEIRRLAPPFGEALGRVKERCGAFELVLPTVRHLVEPVTRATKDWTIRPRIVADAEEKRACFRIGRAALAKSGTVTLELALAGIPMVAAYRLSAWEVMIARKVISVSSVILANLVIGENAVPEFLQEECEPQKLADALVPLIGDSAERHRQVDAFARLDATMEIGRAAPSVCAAEIVLGVAAQARNRVR